MPIRTEKTTPLFCVIETDGLDEPIILIANEGRATLTITTRVDSLDPSPRRYEIRRQNGALTLIEVGG
jgi:hypothetical protein